MAERRFLVARAEGAQIRERRLARGELGLRLEHAMRGVQHLDRFLPRREEVADVRPADQPEPLDLAGMDRREDLSDPAAERLAGDDRAVDPDLPEEQVEIVRVFFCRVVAVRSAAVAVAPLVERVDVKRGAECARRLLPHPPVAGRRVQQHEVRPRSRPLVVVELQAVRQAHGLVLEVTRGCAHGLVPPDRDSTLRGLRRTCPCRSSSSRVLSRGRRCLRSRPESAARRVRPRRGACSRGREAPGTARRAPRRPGADSPSA